MRKTYQLELEGKNRDRLLDASKHDIRKYVKRERSRPLPAGVDYWDFDCKFGTSEADAAPVHFSTLIDQINTLASEGGKQFYVEVVTTHGVRGTKPRHEAPDAEDLGGDLD